MSATDSGPLNLDSVKIDPAWALRIPASLAMRRQLLPFAFVEGTVCVACVAEPDAATAQALQRQVQQPVRYYSTEATSLRRALERIFANNSQGANRGGRTDGDPDSASTLCDELLNAALLRQASDIHIDPSAERLNVRFRVDGVLEDYRPLQKAMHLGIISRFKVLSSIDIAEKRAAQDGHFNHVTPSGNRIDIRVATLPTRHGERMTLRLLATERGTLTLETLGMGEHDLNTFSRAIDRPHGLILITGPTGSGKSTTLYALLQRLVKARSYNIITIEDPIEYEIDGVAQVEVDSADKVSFANALRGVLRHDPDIVMIGEIRDGETAGIAIKSALTGHLVLSTLHTNSAISAVTRLADMGVDRFLIAATLRLAAAQRLVRRLCSHCRKPRPLTDAEAELLQHPEAAGKTVYDPVGCMYCANRGFVGRMGVFEALSIEEEIARRISAGADEADLLQSLKANGAMLLSDDGLEKLLAGATSPGELLAAVTAW